MPWRRRIARRLRLWALALDPPQPTNYACPPEWSNVYTNTTNPPPNATATSDAGDLLAQLWRLHGMRGVG